MIVYKSKHTKQGQTRILESLLVSPHVLAAGLGVKANQSHYWVAPAIKGFVPFPNHHYHLQSSSYRDLHGVIQEMEYGAIFIRWERVDYSNSQLLIFEWKSYLNCWKIKLMSI